MNKLKGLLRKEWVLLRWGIFLLILTYIIVLLAAPTIIHIVFGVPLDLFQNRLGLFGLLFVFTMLVSLGMLFTSLRHEMRRPDVWLHSPASMLQLVGAKAIIAVLTTAFLLLLSSVLLGISYYFSDARGTISFFEGSLVVLSVIIALFLNSIYIMAIGFMFWVIHQITRSYIGEVAFIVTLGVFFAGAYVWEKLMISGLFHGIKEIGPVQLTNHSFSLLGFNHDGIAFTSGNLLLNGIFVAVIFIFGSKLFEKKVRL